MPILSYILRDVLFDTSECCFLCFNKLCDIETPNNIGDEVFLGTDIETTEVLYEIINTVLGDKVLDSVTAHKICQTCTGTAITCYKFIKQCRLNIEQLHYTIDSLQEVQEHAQNISAGNYDYNKSLFVAVDTSNHNVALYYDKHRNIHNKTLLRKRFQKIYKDSQQFYSDIEVESNFSPDNKNCAVKKRKQNRILHSKKLADIVHDKDNLNNLQCKTCLKLFPTVANMRRHYLRVHAPKEFKCSQCPRSFGSSLILNEHVKYGHNSVVCSQCGKTLNNIYSLRRHEQGHKTTCHICQKCGKIYKSKRAFNIHIENKLCQKMRKSNAESKFSCDYCGKKYAQKTALSGHIRLEHENGKAEICNWCGKKLSSISRLKDHILTHTKQKDFECEQCGGRFVTKTSLLYHTRTHTGEKPYKCEHCEKSFLSISRRTDHVKLQHTQSNLECDICHGKFKGNKSLRNHKRKHSDVTSRLYCNPPDSFV